MLAITETLTVSMLILAGAVGAAFLLIGGIVVLYFKWKRFHDLVNSTAKWIWQNWKYMILFLAVLGPIGWGIAIFGSLVKYFQDVAAAIAWVVRELNKVPDLGKKGLHILHTSINLGTPLPSFHASGGFMSHAGNTWVGERGPELVHLPGGSSIIPHGGSVSSVGTNVGGNSGGGEPIVVQVMLDRKVLAEAVARANQDYAARR